MDSELLFIIKKKFCNSRVVRNIYEYLKDTRTTWLKKYRDVINNGRCPVTSRFYYLHTGVCSWKTHRENAICISGAERYWRLTRLANVRELEKIKYITPLTMNMVLFRARQCRNPLMHKFTTKRLFDCCIENKTPGVEHLIRGRYSRETLIKSLMSI
jgi:hypothetical protein